MSGVRPLSKQWTKWSHGELGFSRTDGQLRTEMSPEKDERGLIHWVARSWIGSATETIIMHVTASTFWDCAEEWEDARKSMRGEA